MSYQVIARKWRPQSFDAVVGQHGVTQTLRNAIGAGRIAHAFVFAGARGVGKTTTARILAKALNCHRSDRPTPDPCGECDSCREIADGRNLDVLEIDAATHTGVDNVRDVIIESLSISPVRDRYKVFIIDEVHMLSGSSFNALLKSVEEPPSFVVFIMATTELHKIPVTITSRSQVYEFRTIGVRAIAEQLQMIADADGIAIDAAALHLLARAGEGSMRDAESALEQVNAFAAEQITTETVAMVLGLIGRDALLDIVETVADERAADVFDLVGRITESGQDLKLVVRELTRLVRDMLLLSIDPARTADPEFAPDGDIERLRGLTARFSREDLLRAFDLLQKSEFDVRTASQPRYAMEMALLKWMHLRKLTPLEDVILSLADGGAASSGRPVPRPGPASPGGGGPVRRPTPPSTSAAAARPAPAAGGGASVRPTSAPPLTRPAPSAPSVSSAPPPASAPPVRSAVSSRSGVATPTPDAAVLQEPLAPPPTPPPTPGSRTQPFDADAFRARLGDEIRKRKRMLHGVAVAAARRIDIDASSIRFVFTPVYKQSVVQIEKDRAFLEALVVELIGYPMTITAELVAESEPATASDAARDALRDKALAETAVQGLLDVFPGDIRDVQEIP